MSSIEYRITRTKTRASLLSGVSTSQIEKYNTSVPWRSVERSSTFPISTLGEREHKANAA